MDDQRQAKTLFGVLVSCILALRLTAAHLNADGNLSALVFLASRMAPPAMVVSTCCSKPAVSLLRILLSLAISDGNTYVISTAIAGSVAY